MPNRRRFLTLAAGALDFTPMSDWMLDWLFGAHPTDAVRTAWTDFLRLFARDVGFSATQPDQIGGAYREAVAGLLATSHTR